jgi:hypothetical protein
LFAIGFGAIVIEGCDASKSFVFSGFSTTKL